MTVNYFNNQERKSRLTAELTRVIDILKNVPGIEKVIVFGSFVSGKIGTASDLDLIVIQSTGQRFLNRSIDLVTQINPTLAMDIFVYTPAEFEQMLDLDNTFIKHALESGRVVYEKGTSR